MLSDEQIRQFTHLLANYSEVCKKVDYPWHENVGPNLGHSTLFRRLAQSQPLYKYPPPRAMSYPWYELLDEGQDKERNLILFGRGDAETRRTEKGNSN